MSGGFSRRGRGLALALLCLSCIAGAWAQQVGAAPPLPPVISALPPLPETGVSIAPPPPPANLHGLFYATDADSGIASLRAHADRVSLIAPQCFALDRHGDLHGSLPGALMTIARAHQLPVVPLVINDGFSRSQAHALLHDAEARDRAVGALIETARNDGLAGFQIDFEGLSWTDRDAFSRFVAELAAGLHRHGQQLSVAVAARTSESVTDNFKTYSGVYDYERLAAAADFLSVMAYPEHSGNDPGPLASYPWVQQVIQHELQSIPPDKFSLGVPTYETDWSERRVRISIWRRIGRRLKRFFRWSYHLFGRTHPASADAGAALHWDPVLKSSYRAYGSGRHRHVIWVEDARSFAAKLELVRQYHLRGFSVWRLGLEDPAIWAQLPAPAIAPSAMAVDSAPAAARAPIGAKAFAAAARVPSRADRNTQLRTADPPAHHSATRHRRRRVAKRHVAPRRRSVRVSSAPHAGARVAPAGHATRRRAAHRKRLTRRAKAAAAPNASRKKSKPAIPATGAPGAQSGH